MKKIIFSLLFVFAATALTARNITGRVVDNAGNPIVGVSVFYDMTSTYTVTDNAGHFTLPRNPRLHTTVIFTHLSYEPQAFPYPYEIPEPVVLQEKAVPIELVIVTAVQRSVFGRRAMLAAFRDQFLGTTSEGRSCTIENEDNIQLLYNKEERRLYAACSSPLIIRNKALGYTIRYFLNSFFVEYAKSLTLDNSFLTRYHINGQAAFEDVNPSDPRVDKRRAQSYGRSYRRFWYDLLHGTITTDQRPWADASHFQIFRNDGAETMLDPHKIFIITPIGHMNLVEIDPGDELDPYRLETDFPFMGGVAYACLFARYKRHTRAGIVFTRPSFGVDDYGNTGDDSGLFYLGAFSNQRVGNMMPRDYLPE